MLFVNKTGPTTWDNARTAAVIKLWNEGHSASVIAAHIGGVSRSAIIGKVHRMGLDARKTVSFVSTGTRLKRAGTPKRPPPVRLSSVTPVFKERAIPALVAPSLEHKVSFLNLDKHHCRFPLWTAETHSSDRFYCGSPKSGVPEDSPYCGWHHKHTHNGFQHR